MTSNHLDRRTFIAGTTTGLTAAAGLGTAVCHAETSGDRPAIRARVLEFEDRWTDQSTGLGRLLEEAGIGVSKLQLDRSPLEQQAAPHLIAFGSFTNNDPAYKDYVSRYTQEIQRFVAAGGVVLEMTQSDQYGNTVSYLPSGMEARRGDRDLSAVIALDPMHPIVEGMFPEGVNQVGSEYFHRNHPNWESFDSWCGLRVLLASEADGHGPCLLEGAYGKGRFLLSSLWIDKCFDAQGKPSYGKPAVEVGLKFASAVANYVHKVTTGKAPQVQITPVPPQPPTGPMLGHVDTHSARVWFRPGGDRQETREWQCIVRAAGNPIKTATSVPDADHDFTLLFDMTGLRPASQYTYEIRPAKPGDTSVCYGPHEFQTDSPEGTASKIVLGLGSCAPSDPNYVWTRIIDEGCEGFVFLGDTPYVDSSDLKVARDKHRRFLSQPEISKMIAKMPCWGTWDDHDFGRNDGHGDFPGKHICRTAFTEYRANKDFGHTANGNLQNDRFGDGRGIYTSFRRGPLEVFLIDPRWFSRTESSWADPDETTCIGKVQWNWLREGLKQSTATFKALATGMIWDDKTNSEKDDWHTYQHEREAIFDFIRDEGIAGCFLIGGDIHVSRALNYGPRVGYDLWQFIISPLHNGVIPSLDVPHPNLVYHAIEPYVFLRLEVDSQASPARLKAEWINRDGKRIFQVQLDSQQLAPKA